MSSDQAKTKQLARHHHHHHHITETIYSLYGVITARFLLAYNNLQYSGLPYVAKNILWHK